MKGELGKFSQIIDGERKLVYRSKYPRCIIEIFSEEIEGSKLVLDLLGLKFYTAVRSDFDCIGEFSNAFLREVARWWCFNHGYDSIDKQNTQSELEPGQPVNLRQIFEFLNEEFVSKDCFGKDLNWLKQRLSGQLASGQQIGFYYEQRQQLSEYLRLKAQELHLYSKMLR